MIGRVCVTGGAGFIGSHMVRTLLDAGIQVRVVDNLRTGRREFIQTDNYNTGEVWDLCEFVQADITRDHDQLMTAIDGCDWVVHLAANPDARGERRGIQFNVDQNITGTLNVLDAMNHVGTTRILYASSASVYGNTTQTPVPEDFALVPQASFYGASKLAAEGFIGAYTEMYDFTAVIARWVHILGERYLHGHIIDFIRRLRRDPSHLHILGDGQQQKSGLHAANLCDGLVRAMWHHDLDAGLAEAYNFGGDTLLPVWKSAALICQTLGLETEFTYSGRPNGGWVGDNPRLVLDSTKAKTTLGWVPTMTVPDAIQLTAEWLTGPECHYL
jgi:UDP-glucose 4-epimerase